MKISLVPAAKLHIYCCIISVTIPIQNITKKKNNVLINTSYSSNILFLVVELREMN